MANLMNNVTQLDISSFKGRAGELTRLINKQCSLLTQAGYMPNKLLLTRKQYRYLAHSRELREYPHTSYKAEDRIYINEHCAMELSIV